MPELIEALIDLGAAFLSASGCTHPERAVDGDPASAATFGPPGTLSEPWTPVTSPVEHKGEVHAAAFSVSPGTVYPRYLQAVWGYDTFVTQVRIKATGDALQNVGVSLLSALGFLENGGLGDPPEIPLLIPPFPDDDGYYSVEFDPPLFALGVVVHPDALLSAAELAALAPGAYPTLLLSQLDVLEAVEEGQTSMSQPQEQRVRIGVSDVHVHPWNGATGPYDATNRCNLYGLDGIDIGTTVKNATITGGETTHVLGIYETGREVKLKITAKITDLMILKYLLGGAFAVDPAAANVGEVQYLAPNYSDRAPYFRLFATSTNGDGTDTLVWAKCKVEGSIAFNLQTDKEAVLSFECMAVWDKTFVRQDGATGGIGEQLFGSKGETTRHS